MSKDKKPWPKPIPSDQADLIRTTPDVTNSVTKHAVHPGTYIDKDELKALEAVAEAAANVYFDDDGIDHGTLELAEAVIALEAGRKGRS